MVDSRIQGYNERLSECKKKCEQVILGSSERASGRRSGEDGKNIERRWEDRRRDVYVY